MKDDRKDLVMGHCKSREPQTVNFLLDLLLRGGPLNDLLQNRAP